LAEDLAATAWTCSASCEAHFHGLYIFPGLPNATSVQQTTHHDYSLFKSTMRRNLDAIATFCFVWKEPIEQLNISTIGLIVYGGVCPQTGVVCEDAVAKAFSLERCLESWVAVGTVPFIMQCLNNPNVHNDGNNEMRGTPNLTNTKSSSQKMISSAQLHASVGNGL